ncbi:MAG: hypothetical protein ACXWDN_07050 [Limisphaerales bacterium]
MAHDPNLANLAVYYSGGGANSTLSASIGGAISSSRVLSQTATGVTMTGVTVADAEGNGVGDGILTYTASSHSFTWTPYAGTTGDAVVVAEDGVYSIQGGSNGGALLITVVFASLPTSTTSDTITIANQTQKFFADITKAEADTGVIKYHCFAIKNTHATLPIVGIKLYIAANTPGADTKTLYLDPIVAGTGGTGPTAVANENTAPAASTFVAPTSATHASALDVGTLTAGQCRFFWIKEDVPVSTSTATAVNTFSLGIYARA